MLTLVAYAANTGLLPDDPKNPFPWKEEDAPTHKATAGDTTASVRDCLLWIKDPDPDPSHRKIFARFDALQKGDYAVFEISCRVISSEDENPGAIFGFIDTEKMLQVYLTKKSGVVYLKDRLRSFDVDTSLLHTYRIVKARADTMNVFVDGELAISIQYDDLEDRPTEIDLVGFQRQVMTTSGAGISEWEIAYACYGISG